MINLIPESVKNALRQVVVTRIIVVFLVFFIIAEIIGILLLVPSYALVVTKDSSRIANQKSIDEMKNSQQESGLSDSIKDVNDKVVILLNNKVFSSSTIVSDLISKRVPGVSVTGMTFNTRLPAKRTKTSSSGATTTPTTPDPIIRQIEVDGTAITKSALLSYIALLKKDAMFSDVNVPIDSIVKEKNVPFAIVLTIAS